MFKPAFDLARQNNLWITAHCAEIADEDDSTNILSFRPDRLGHMVILTPDIRQRLLSLQPPIPIEICPSSNFKTLGLNCHSEHPTVKQWLDSGYPFSINTDDTGVFGTSLSREYALVCEAFHFGNETVSQIAMDAVDQIFDAQIKDQLKDIFAEHIQSFLKKQQQQIILGEESTP